MSLSLMTRAFLEIEVALTPLFDALDNEMYQTRLLAMVGYKPDAVSSSNLYILVQSLKTGYTDLQALLATPATSLADLRNQLGKVQNLLRVLSDLQNLLVPNASAAAATGLVQDLTVALFGNYLQGAHPTLYALLVLLEVVEDPYSHDPEPAVLDANGGLVRASYRAYYFHFDRLASLLSDPAGYVKKHYYPNGLPDRATANAVADKLFPRLGQLLRSIGMHASYGMSANETLSYGPISDELQRHMLTVVLIQGRVAAFGFTLVLSSAQDGDLGLVIAPFGTLEYHHSFETWIVDLLLSVSINGLAIGPQGVLIDGGIGSFGTSASVKSQPDESDNAFLFGAPQGTHLAIGEVAFQAGLQVTNGQADYGVLAKASQAKFVLRPEEAGGFLGAIIPAAGVSGAFDLGLGWSKGKGFYLLGSALLTAHYTITNSVIDRLLIIRGVDVGLTAANDKLLLSATASGRVKLGPVQAELTDIGAVATITFPGSGGNLGVANAEVSFRYPAGIGITVDSDLVTGGGYLFLDPATHTYAGAANLTLKTASRDINLNALGILQTQLPDQPNAYSLVLLITAQFDPIELGLGFTLNGLGGLIGVNRRADTNFLLNMVRRGELDKLLFPANVLDDPAGALALLDGAFPAQEGRYIIGLLGELGWGLPNIITLDVALLLEFPAPLQVIILGVLQAVLPDKEAKILRLRADFLGSVDFGAKKVRFDAALTDSHILDFALTGDMAFRLYQGANPLFLIAAGGFHPAFQPPAGAELGTLRRLTLALSRGNLELTLAAYFAVTANTVQFGAHLDLVYGIGHGFRVEGHFGCDALFQFHPFHVLLHLAADVAIKAGSHELLSVHLDLDVAGPGPWHLRGEASFRVLFIRVGFHINATLGSSSPTEAPQLPPDAHAPLVAALQDPASWSVEAPATVARPGGVVLRPAGAAPGQLFIDPRGALVVRQRVAPLGLQLEKYGSSSVAPVNGRRFDLLGLVLGEAASGELHGGPEVEAVQDFFAPDQYRVLSDGQKLSRPSFQSLPCGLRLKRLAGLKTAPTATRRVVAYEHKRLDGTSVRLPRADGGAFQQLAQGSALGQAVRAEQPSARAPQPAGWGEDTYAVVFAADLRPYPAATGQPQDQFGSEVEATQYRQTLLDAAELLVVPSYQLALA